MNEVYIDGKKTRLDPNAAVGKGGEADIFRIDDDTVVKVYKAPDHADFFGFPAEADMAVRRIAEQQDKLPQFPRNLPNRVVGPLKMATDRSGRKILGYTMRFVAQAEVLFRYSERSFRSSIADAKIPEIFRDLHVTVRAVHESGVVIGDFNDLNIMVRNAEAFLIDADSFQYGKFLCRVYTERFVDPLLCDPKASRPALIKPHNADSDWYAYAVMLMKCLVFCDPYGGVFKPRKGRADVLHAERPLRRITVFDRDVKYPRPAIPYEYLPDEILHHLHLVFEKDQRGEFPLRLVQNLSWTKCKDCGTEHGRPACPVCKKAAPVAAVQAVQVRGKVTSKRVFRTSGEILFATVQDGELLWLYREGDALLREGGREIASKPDLGRARFRIQGEHTLVGKHDRFDVLPPLGDTTYVDRYGNLPVFDANAGHRYWVENGVLQHEGLVSPTRIGEVLKDQTLFWVGSKFGFGFYRAGELSVAFVFDAERKGINDSVRLPALRGQLVDARCFFSSTNAWFLASLKREGRIFNRCTVVRPDGTVEAMAEGEDGDGSWLGTIRGRCAVGHLLFAATDDGILRVEIKGGALQKTAAFPDTEPFVHSGCHLFPAKEGIYVIDRKEITLLKIM